jgi:hypothetical protein
MIVVVVVVDLHIVLLVEEEVHQKEVRKLCNRTQVNFLEFRRDQ